MKIKCGEDIRHAQGAGGVPAARGNQHVDDRLEDFLRFFLKRENLFFSNRHLCDYTPYWLSSDSSFANSAAGSRAERSAEPTTRSETPSASSCFAFSSETPPST